MIGRYAMTIGATDPSHYDSEAARSAGYPDVVAPPNMLAAIAEWGIGTPEAAAAARRDARTTVTCPSGTASSGFA